MNLLGQHQGSLQAIDQARGPLRIQGNHGPVALRNIRYRRYEGPPLEWLSLAHAGGRMRSPYERTFPTEPSAQLFTGTSSTISTDITAENEKLALRFRGRLRFPTTGLYTFELDNRNLTFLSIDGQALIEQCSGSCRSSTLLAAGEHEIEVLYLRWDPWDPKQLALYVNGPGLARQALHDPASLPFERFDPPIFLDFGRRPVIQRSYTDVPYRSGGGSQRNSYSIHVGFSDGQAFTYHPGSGNLLQCWRGGFLETTGMWAGRGDGSARPLGACVILDTLPAWTGATDGSLKPALQDTDVRPLGYFLDPEGIPTFRYRLGAAAVSDCITPLPAGVGLQRQLRWEGTPSSPGQWRLPLPNTTSQP
ncbi:MAG: hypothetical protein HC821_04645 [Lewinella sp.]|nr:hypothetical protein [Lewinella sp.]